jgi:hypothetical protein
MHRCSGVGEKWWSLFKTERGKGEEEREERM